MKTLAKAVGLSEAVVSTHTGTAESKGYLRKERRSNYSIIYTITIQNHPHPSKGETVSKTMSRPANDSAETYRQARSFDTNKRHYEALGLCGRCAAQAAWGHQLGFSRIKPPCGGCWPLVDTIPVDKTGKWRSKSPRRGAK